MFVMTLDGVLLAWPWRSQTQLEAMSLDDKRNTLIAALAENTNQDASYFQRFNNDALIGKGAVLAHLHYTKGRSVAALKGMSDDDQRNTLIVGTHIHTGIPVPVLQGYTNQELVLAGFPVRQNVAHVSEAERRKLINTILELNKKKYSNGVSYWYEQDAIHQATEVHGTPAFLPWHRVLLNRFEAQLREIDPTVALHYWDWTTDPRASPDGKKGKVNLFESYFMGSAEGPAGSPIAGYLDNGGKFQGSREQTGNQGDPPQQITRGLKKGAPPVDSDSTIINWGNNLDASKQWQAFRKKLEGSPNHNSIHGWIGGTDGPPDTAFDDPFIFLAHANIDRLWAMWQLDTRYPWRTDPKKVYGSEASDPSLTKALEPWAGGTSLEPWKSTKNFQTSKTALDPTVVAPPRYL